MRTTRSAFFVLVILSITQLTAAQQAATSDTQGLLILRKAMAAMVSPAARLADVTLSGAARRIAGSDDETGTAVFEAMASGAGRVDLSLSSGQRSEVLNLTSTIPSGTWSGPDRVAHAVAYYNLLTEPAWFFPAFAIARRLPGSSFVATYVGQETRDGQAVEHVSVSQTSSVQGSPGTPTFQHLTQVEFFLDSTTFLPAAMSFNTHPGNDMGLDIPIEVRFSDYRSVNGAQVPFHVQRYLNNTLSLDFQAESVTVNSGLSASAFRAQ